MSSLIEWACQGSRVMRPLSCNFTIMLALEDPALSATPPNTGFCGRLQA